VVNEFGVREEIRPKKKEIELDYQKLLGCVYRNDMVVEGKLRNTHFILTDNGVTFRDVLNPSRTHDMTLSTLSRFVSSERQSSEKWVEDLDGMVDVAGLFYYIRNVFYGSHYKNPWMELAIKVRDL
jgi:hypothetical protein